MIKAIGFVLLVTISCMGCWGIGSYLFQKIILYQCVNLLSYIWIQWTIADEMEKEMEEEQKENGETPHGAGVV